MLGAINMFPATAIEFENDKITKAAYHRLKLAKIAVRRHALLLHLGIVYDNETINCS